MRLIPTALVLCLASIPALAAAHKNAIVVPIKTSTGEDAGTATFTPSKKGVHLKLDLKNLPVGEHGVHVHASPHCDPPDFKTAGGHFNLENKHHGFLSADGPHTGDLPNVDTPPSGPIHFEFLLADVSLKGRNALLDADGAAIIVHSARDDYATDPAGNSGARMACGVIALR